MAYIIIAAWANESLHTQIDLFRFHCKRKLFKFYGAGFYFMEMKILLQWNISENICVVNLLDVYNIARAVTDIFAGRLQSLKEKKSSSCSRRTKNNG